MISRISNPGLARRRPWHRFPDQVEPDYQHWATEQVRPVGILVAACVLVVWLTMPIHTVLVLGDQTPPGIFVVELVVMPLMELTWFVLLLLPWTRERAPLWNVLAVLLAFVGVLFAVRVVYGVTQGGAVYTAIFACLFLTLLRVPFRGGAVVSLLVTGAAAAVTGIDISAGHLSLREAYPALTMLAVTTVMVAVVALLAEHTARQSWARGRLIEQQQEQLAESRRLIRRYVPPTVAAQIEQGHGADVDAPVRRRVTIMFSDVVGFTAMADRLDPESLTEVINDYLGEVADIVEEHGGTLNEFAGDGFMAVFGAPEVMEPEAQVTAAIAAGRAVHARLPELHRRWERLGVDRPVRTRIGINTGMLSVGTFGSAGRATYTAIGLQTNIAARIQAQCEPGSILLSQASWNLVKDLERGAHRGAVEVKGVHFPIDLYEPRGPLEPAAAPLAAATDR